MQDIGVGGTCGQGEGDQKLAKSCGRLLWIAPNIIPVLHTSNTIVQLIVTTSLHSWYTGVTPLFHLYYTLVTLFIPPLLHNCYTFVTLWLHSCYTLVSLLLHSFLHFCKIIFLLPFVRFSYRGILSGYHK